MALRECGHQVTVVASSRSYDDPAQRFPKNETWNGITIHRVPATGFGKSAPWRRALDFATFFLGCLARLAMLPRHDAIVALTSPPLIAFLAAWLARLRRSQFFYWVMDLNPDEAIAAGWFKENSLVARLLDRMSRFSLRHATKIIVLDHFMRDRIAAKGIDTSKIVVLPPWSHDSEVHFDPVGREQFRRAHGFDHKFVVMYAGNHSPCHPLDTLLQASQRLRFHPDVVFCLVGGGSEFRKLQKSPRSPNQVFLPYQPFDKLAGSLAAADLHVVVMGDPFVGIVHPCKIYNVLKVGAPVLYIGPQESHLSELLRSIHEDYPYAMARHGDVDAVVKRILELRQRNRPTQPPAVVAQFSKHRLLPAFVKLLEQPASRAPRPLPRGSAPTNHARPSQ